MAALIILSVTPATVIPWWVFAIGLGLCVGVVVGLRRKTP